MNVEELLLAAGDLPLHRFAWGKRIVEIINFVADEQHKVSLKLSGAEAKIIVAGMDEESKERLSRIQVDIRSGKTHEIGGDLHEDVINDTPTIIAPVASQMGRFPPLVEAVRIEKPFSTKPLLWIGVAITSFALLVVIDISSSNTRDAQKVDKSALQSIVSTISEFFSTSSPYGSPYQSYPQPYGPAIGADTSAPPSTLPPDPSNGNIQTDSGVVIEHSTE